MEANCMPQQRLVCKGFSPHVHQVSFPCRLEVNSGGGESLYRAAAQHAGLGQEAFKELRRYFYETEIQRVYSRLNNRLSLRVCQFNVSNEMLMNMMQLPGRYCHTKLAEWWQWYEPYYAFPIQVFHCPTNHLHTISACFLTR